MNETRSPKRRTQAERSETTRTRLLEAAMKVVAKRGYSGFTTAEAARLASQGLYDPANEHDNCGVGMVASIDGTPRRDVVEAGIDALKAVWHRGAVDAGRLRA